MKYTITYSTSLSLFFVFVPSGYDTLSLFPMSHFRNMKKEVHEETLIRNRYNQIQKGHKHMVVLVLQHLQKAK